MSNDFFFIYTYMGKTMMKYALIICMNFILFFPSALIAQDPIWNQSYQYLTIEDSISYDTYENYWDKVGSLIDFYGHGDSLTREQAAKMILYGIPLGANRDPNQAFPDTGLSDWFYTHVENLVVIGIINGEMTEYTPVVKINRAEIGKLKVEDFYLPIENPGEQTFDFPRYIKFLEGNYMSGKVIERLQYLIDGYGSFEDDTADSPKGDYSERQIINHNRMIRSLNHMIKGLNQEILSPDGLCVGEMPSHDLSHNFDIIELNKLPIEGHNEQSIEMRREPDLMQIRDPD